MGFRKTPTNYGGYQSWRVWRGAKSDTLARAGVPSSALESERNWALFLQEGDPTLFGGSPFSVLDLTREQQAILKIVLGEISTHARGGDLIDDLARALED